MKSSIPAIRKPVKVLWKNVTGVKVPWEQMSRYKSTKVVVTSTCFFFKKVEVPSCSKACLCTFQNVSKWSLLAGPWVWPSGSLTTHIYSAFTEFLTKSQTTGKLTKTMTRKRRKRQKLLRDKLQVTGSITNF